MLPNVIKVPDREEMLVAIVLSLSPNQTAATFGGPTSNTVRSVHQFH
jgi:hypothetical protein